MMFKKVFLFMLLIQVVALPQSLTNLQVLNNLIAGSVNTVKANTKEAGALLLSNNTLLSPLNVKIVDLFGELSGNKNDTLLFNIVDVKFKYSEPFRKSFLSSIYLVREAEITTTYSFMNSHHEFKSSISDTIKAGDIPELEKDPFTFTKGEIPQEGFIDSFLEPVLAITATAAAVILFFVVRSN